MRKIVLDSVYKSFENEEVLKNFSLEVPGGKFFALLGPSGCGKTTVLRLIAGLEKLDSGRIWLGTTEISEMPVYERKINTVFQQYALFPHLTVFENVAYSLRIRGLAGAEIKRKVREALRTVRLIGHEQKRIQSLSGGEQQRVAIARAIINEPDVLLLDEPFAALDPALKEQMLIELIDLQDKLKATFIYITHDQSEALTVADKMAIMNENGEIEQIGSPKEIYEFPNSTFVASFVGQTNIFRGTLKYESGDSIVEIPGFERPFIVYQNGLREHFPSGSKVFVSVRPEKIFISKKPMENFSNMLTGVVDEIIYHGRATQYNVRLDRVGKIVKIFEQNEEHFPSENIDYEDRVYLYFQKENLVLLDR